MRESKKQRIQDFVEYNDSNKLSTELYLRPFQFPSQNHITRDLSYADSETSNVSRRSSVDRSRRQTLPIKRFVATPFNNSCNNFSSKWNCNEEFHIESIVSCNLINNRPFFLVKWKDYPASENTWEGLDKLRETLQLNKFLANKCLAVKHQIDMIQKGFIKTANTRTIKKKILKMMDKMKNIDKLEFKSHQLIYLMIKDKKTDYSDFKANYEKEVLFFHYKKMLKDEQKLYNDYTTEIKKLDKFSLQFKVENLVDFGKLPEKFIYINVNRFQPSLKVLQKEIGSGCNCGKDCSTSCCCQPQNKFFSYSKNKKLRVNALQTKIIYECNDLCSCGIDCTNRLTQQNPNLNLCLFKTSNGRGWGVKTLKPIPTGNFVMEYVGEVIDFDETERRGVQYNKMGVSYLFDLDFNADYGTYTVDATRYGNMSRFFNHSCDPNCVIWPVSTISANKSIYKLCFFALKKIHAYEELTFEYSGGGYFDENKNQSEKREKCTCGAEKCRGFIFKI